MKKSLASKPYDASLKHIIEDHPADWLALVGHPGARFELIDADLSTVSAAADKVILVHDDPSWLLNLELQASRDADFPKRIHWYNSLLDYRQKFLVHSVAVLLRPEADGPEMTGLYERAFPGQSPYRTFHYQVLRLWQMPVETFLEGGLGIVPLAILSKVKPEQTPVVIQQMAARIKREARPNDAKMLWAATRVLTGLRKDRESLLQVLQGAISMHGIYGIEESTFYQEILKKGEAKGKAEGKAEEAKNLLLELGKDRFGRPNKSVQKTIAAMRDLDHIEQLIRKISKVEDWQQLLAE